jgi:hypothetical protein
VIVGVNDGEFTPSGSRAESRLVDLGVAAAGVRGPGEGHHSSKKPETRLGVAGAMLRGVLHRFEGDGGTCNQHRFIHRTAQLDAHTLELLVSGDVALIGDCSHPTRPAQLNISQLPKQHASRPNGLSQSDDPSGVCELFNTSVFGVVTAETGVFIAATGVVTGVEGCTGQFIRASVATVRAPGK